MIPSIYALDFWHASGIFQLCIHDLLQNYKRISIPFEIFTDIGFHVYKTHTEAEEN